MSCKAVYPDSSPQSPPKCLAVRCGAGGDLDGDPPMLSPPCRPCGALAIPALVCARAWPLLHDGLGVYGLPSTTDVPPRLLLLLLLVVIVVIFVVAVAVAVAVAAALLLLRCAAAAWLPDHYHGSSPTSPTPTSTSTPASPPLPRPLPRSPFTVSTRLHHARHLLIAVLPIHRPAPNPAPSLVCTAPETQWAS